MSTRSMTASRSILPSAGAAMARMGALCGELASPPRALETLNGNLCVSAVDECATSRGGCRWLPVVHFVAFDLSQSLGYEGGEVADTDRNRATSLTNTCFRCRGCLHADFPVFMTLWERRVRAQGAAGAFVSMLAAD